MKHFGISSSAAELMAQARASTGIDIIDSAIAEPLEKLLQSLNTEAMLSEQGARNMTLRLSRILRNRLRMQRDFRHHPEIDEQAIVRPLILSGAARTGSTKLHKMLSASGDFQHTICWHGLEMSLITGDRGEDPAARIRAADEENRRFNDHAPHARLIHEYSTHETEEETLIYEHMLFGGFMATIAYVPSYAQWSMVDNRDIGGEIKFLRQGLKYLQWQFRDGDPRRWLLKSPIYNGIEYELAKYFPDARFVTTNRDPVSAMSSSISLQYLFKDAYSNAVPKEIIGLSTLEGLGMCMDMYLAARDDYPEIKFLDLSYSQLTKEPERVVEQVYAHIGMPLSDRAMMAMRAWERDNGQHKLGVHNHKLEEYAVTKEMVVARFKPYIDRFAHCF